MAIMRNINFPYLQKKQLFNKEG